LTGSAPACPGGSPGAHQSHLAFRDAPKLVLEAFEGLARRRSIPRTLYELIPATTARTNARSYPVVTVPLRFRGVLHPSLGSGAPSGNVAIPLPPG
jgi:hypothetical protein